MRDVDLWHALALGQSREDDVHPTLDPLDLTFSFRTAPAPKELVRVEREPVGVDELVALLDDCAREPMNKRAPFAAGIARASTHKSPRVRAAATRALAGMIGLDGKRAIVERLDDANGDVRMAAVDALAESVVHDGAPFACALFHRRVDVRKRALARLGEKNAPARVPLAHAIYLLADKAHEAGVLELLEKRATDGAVAMALLSARKLALLDENEVVRRLARVPFADMSAEVFPQMPFPQAIDAQVATADGLHKYITALTHTDPFADVLALLWRHPQDDASAPLSDDAPIVAQLIDARRANRMRDMELRRVALCATQVALTKAQSSPRLLALSSLAVPPALIVIGNTDKKQARAALLALPAVAGELVGRATALKPFLDAGLLHATDDKAADALDAKLVAGALRLVFDAPYQRLKETISIGEVVNAFWREPLASTQLFSMPPRNPADREAYRALVRAAVTSMKKPEPDVVAALCAVLPSEAGFALEELEKQKPGLAEASLRLLLTEDQQQPAEANARRVERNAAILAAQLSSSTLPKLLHDFPKPRPSSEIVTPTIATLAADAVLRAAPKAHLAAGVTALADDADAIGAVVHRLSASALPVDVERAWAQVLAKTSHAEARTWAQPRVSLPDAPRAIAVHLQQHIATASEGDLPLVTSVFLREPLLGLVEALSARKGAPVVSARVAAAILASHDPPHLVAEAFQRSISEAAPFLAAIDHALLDEDTRRDLPLLATAWVHHDAGHAVRFEHHCRTAPGGLKSVIELALSLPAPLLSWKLMRALIEVVRSWSYQRKQLLEKLDDKVADLVVQIIAGKAQPRPPVDAAHASPFNVVRALKRMSAELVAIAHASGKAASFVDDVRAKLNGEIALQTPAKFDVDADVRTILANVVTLPPPSPATPRPPAERLHAPDAHVVKAAVDELNAAGRDARKAIVAALRTKPLPLCASAMIERAIFDDDDFAALLADDVDAEVRFHIALRANDAKAAVEAACAPTDRHWLQLEDVDALVARWNKSPRALMLHLVRAPHPEAYSKAVWSLLSAFHDDPNEHAVRAGLRAFLAAGDDRESSLRAEVTAALLRADEDPAFLAPVLVPFAFNPPDGHPDSLMRDAVPRAAWLDVLEGASVSGEGALDVDLQQLMERRHVDDRLCAEIALHLLKRGVDSEDAPALFTVLRRARFYDGANLDDLRAAVQWGIRQARALMGKPVGVEFIHDALGYTRLHQPRIFINPMPLLRGERGGDDVVRGLMVHEIGHHLYHADDLGKQCWADAQKEGIGGLLNLVADEHLERNLRAESAEYGDHLKVLASYAFQHAARDVWIENVLGYLGRHAARVLTRVRLMPGRRWSTLEVELGKLLAEMSAHTAFARFMRALRQGLGGRSADEKVTKALSLFEKKQFRANKMDRLLAIAREIKTIFGDETKILETFGLHETMEADEDELTQEGFSPDELQREMNRRTSSKTQPIGEKPKFNNSPDERFDVIDQIVPLAHDPVSHRAIAEQARKASRALKSVFDELGTRIVVEHKRMSGRSLDRQGLGTAVIKMDPRLLVRRTPIPAADLFVGVVVDCSGSMASYSSMDKARVFATSLAEAARGHKGVDVRVFGFTDSVIFDAGDANHCAAHALHANGGNNDAAGLWHAALSAKRSKRRRKLLVMVSDGLPTECSASSLRALASRLERNGMLTAQVAVRPISEQCFKHYIEILDDDIDGAARRFARVVSKLVRKTVGAR